MGARATDETQLIRGAVTLARAVSDKLVDDVLKRLHC